MAYAMFTQEWAEAWAVRINESGAYKEAARTWTWPVVLALRADPGRGVPEPLYVFLDLFQGDCRAARTARPDDLESAPYVLAADPVVWKQVLDGKLEPIPGLMRGKIKLERGSLASLLPYVQAAKELVAAATRVDTRFPEGLT
jgi:putative sterol carrier protein